MGDEVNGNMMDVTLTFYMDSVNVNKILEFRDPFFTKYAKKGIKSGRLHRDFRKILDTRLS